MFYEIFKIRNFYICFEIKIIKGKNGGKSGKEMLEIDINFLGFLGFLGLFLE